MHSCRQVDDNTAHPERGRSNEKFIKIHEASTKRPSSLAYYSDSRQISEGERESQVEGDGRQVSLVGSSIERVRRVWHIQVVGRAGHSAASHWIMSPAAHSLNADAAVGLSPARAHSDEAQSIYDINVTYRTLTLVGPPGQASRVDLDDKISIE